MKSQADISEQAYLAALKNDDIKAFDNLFEEYGKRLYHFAYGYLKSKDDAEEIVQEVFLKVWRNRKQLKPDLSFKAYIFKIAYHQILEILKQINRRQAYRYEIIDESIFFNDDTNTRLNYQMLLEKVESLIQKLPSRQREILLKRKKEGIPVKEIATQLGVSPKTVENHLTQALKSIKKDLGEEELSALLFFLLFVDAR